MSHYIRPEAPRERAPGPLRLCHRPAALPAPRMGAPSGCLALAWALAVLLLVQKTGKAEEPRSVSGRGGLQGPGFLLLRTGRRASPACLRWGLQALSLHPGEAGVPLDKPPRGSGSGSQVKVPRLAPLWSL